MLLLHRPDYFDPWRLQKPRAIERVRDRLPFPLRGFDTDNDSAFIHETVLDYCRRTGLEFTRSRAYRKNDQAWVEQKKEAVVRKLIG